MIVVEHIQHLDSKYEPQYFNCIILICYSIKAHLRERLSVIDRVQPLFYFL